MKFLLTWFFCGFFLFMNFCFGWSKLGHYTVAHIAEKQLTDKTKSKIDDLIGNTKLAYISNWADSIKSNPKWDLAKPWHYMNFKGTYSNQKFKKPNDIIQAIQQCLKILKDKEESKKNKIESLKFLVHFLGDLHQPLHISDRDDRGGTQVYVSWFNKRTNFHYLWDFSLLDTYQLSFTELSEFLLLDVSNEQIKTWQKGTIIDWAMESNSFLSKIYEGIDKPISWNYLEEHKPILENQLRKAGVRLAFLLNSL